jgi:hypothetical protein
MKKKKLSYYQQHKNEEWFKEHRRKLAQNYRDTHPEVKGYQRKYQKKYFAENREALNEYRRKHPDPKRNERINRFKKKEREELRDNYIIQLLTGRGKLKKEDVTRAMINKRRKQIFLKRAYKN